MARRPAWRRCEPSTGRSGAGAVYDARVPAKRPPGGDVSTFEPTPRTAVQASAKAGKTAEQAQSDFAVPEKFKSYNMQRAKANIDVIYGELKK